jgi:hypothetical protein
MNWKGLNLSPIGGTSWRLFFAAFLLAVPTRSHLFAATPSSTSELKKAEDRLRTDLADFLPMCNSIRERDRQTCNELRSIASVSADLAEHINDLLTVQSLVKNGADRARIAPLIEKRVGAGPGFLDIQINYVNTTLGYDLTSGLLNAATQLRNDLRELKGVLAPRTEESGEKAAGSTR